MSTVTEIEAAIERLPITQVDELAVWLDEYQHLIHAAAQVSAVYDREEEEQCRKQDEAKSG